MTGGSEQNIRVESRTYTGRGERIKPHRSDEVVDMAPRRSRNAGRERSGWGTREGQSGSKVDFIDNVSVRSLMVFMLKLEVTRNKSCLDV